MNRITLGGLSAIAVGNPAAPRTCVILHGRQMEAADLAPFAHSLISGPKAGGDPTALPSGSAARRSGAAALDAYFVLPDAPLVAEPRGRTWWPVDSEARIRRLSAGPMELSAMDPEGRSEARGLLADACAALGDRPLVIAGFSQGGMLAMDAVLHGVVKPAALALLSSTRIAIADWQPRASQLAGLPVLVAHGHADAELSFVAGELLRDFAIAGGAQVTWLPFEGGHELPLIVWRALRTILRSTGPAS